MPTLSRRALFAAGGSTAAGVALAGCGEEFDPRGEGRDAELIGAALGAEEALASAYGEEARASTGEQARTLEAFAAASEARAAALEPLAGEAGAEPSAGSPQPDAVAASAAAIGAYREAAGLASTTAYRAPMSAHLAACAAELAILAEFAGAEPVPFAFVTGGSARPYEAEPGDEDAEAEAGEGTPVDQGEATGSGEATSGSQETTTEEATGE